MCVCGGGGGEGGYACVYMRRCLYVRTRACVRACVCMYVCMYVCIYQPTYIPYQVPTPTHLIASERHVRLRSTVRKVRVLAVYCNLNMQ